MKIAMFGHKRIPSREGGAEIVVEELSTRMAAMGHELVCYNRSGHHVSGAQYDSESLTEYKGVSLRTVFTIKKRGLAAVSSSAFAALRSAFSKAEVVHIHAEGPAFLAWLPKMFGKRIIVTVHGLDWQREKWGKGLAVKYIRAGEKMAVKVADEIIVLSRNVQDYFQMTYGRRTVWIPNGVGEHELCAPELISEKYGLEKDGYFLFLGRLVPEKGIHYLIKAFRQVKTDKKLIIAGGASDTDVYASRLKELAGNDDRIIFTGFVQGQMLAELLSNSYAFVLPSDVEGMPLSLLEAMSYGNCCIVSDIPECAEVVEDKAVLFNHGSVSSLRESIQKLCDNAEQVAHYKESAQQFICSKYTWDEVVQKTLELYSSPAKKSAVGKIKKTDRETVSV